MVVELEGLVVEKTKAMLAARWPELVAPFASVADAFATHVTSVVSDGRLEDRRLDELALAYLCARQDAQAIERFDREYLSRLPSRVGRIAGDADQVMDVVQLTRERLLLAKGDSPSRMLEYAGAGSLLGWVQVTATRVALNYRKQAAPERYVASDDADLIDATEDATLQLLKARHRADFKAAFTEVIATLSDEERALLRMHHVEDRTLVQIGLVMGLDKANVSRRLTRLRERLFEETRRVLSERLRLGPGEFDSLMHVINSQLDVSLSRILRD